MSHLPQRDARQEQVSPSLDLVQQTLKGLMNSVETVLHPSRYRKMLRQVGVSMGRSAVQRYLKARRAGKPFSRQDYIRIVEDLKERWGWECSVAESSERSITFRIPTCAFGPCAASPDICLVESGILGGIAGDRFGESKVSIHRGEGLPPSNCHIVVYLRRSMESATAEGEVYSRNTISLTNLLREADSQSGLERLSHRQRQLLRLVGEGFPNSVIASALHLSVRTVEGHLGRIYVTLGVKGRSELIRLALHSKLAAL